MSTLVTKPPVLDDTGLEMVEKLEKIAKNIAEQGTSFYYEVRVSIASGSTCYATMGTKVITAISTDDIASLYLDQTGTWTITGQTATGTSMIPEIVTVTDHGIKYITARFKGIYGVQWDGTATTALTRINDSATLDEPVSYVAGMSEGDYGSPFDNIAPWSGMKIVEDSECGSVVSIPKFWYNMTVGEDNSLKLQIAAYQAEGFKCSPAHMDRGDGHGERDVVYVGRYHCAAGYKSKTGVLPLASQTRATFRSGIHGLGDDVWQMDFATRITITMLYLVEYANWNSQETLGYGCGNGSSTENMGSTDSMPYHTGTMQTSKQTYGVGVQYRYIEGLWENVYDWVDGVYFADTSVYGILNPADFSDTTGGTLVCTRPNTSNYISALQQGEGDFDWMLYPSAVSGSGSSYITDYCYFASAGVVLRMGGSYYDRYQYYGLLYCSGSGGASSAYGSVGSRLLKLP